LTKEVRKEEVKMDENKKPRKTDGNGEERHK
jgi:hypothetical protein